MQLDEILARLRRIHVDEVRAWEEDYEGVMADLRRRIGCFTVELARVSGTTVGVNGPVGDLNYYSLELPVRASPGRFVVTADDIDVHDGEVYFLVAYCSTVLPLVEVRWHVLTLDEQGKRVAKSYDIFDKVWLGKHPDEERLALDVVTAAEHCDWQLVGPDVMEQKPPSDWPWPFPTYDYHDGDYLLRDYVLRGPREY